MKYFFHDLVKQSPDGLLHTVSADLLSANYATNQSDQQPLPVTMAAAATIAPTGRLTFLTGTTQVATVTPPLNGHHELILCFTDNAPGALLTTGNLKTAYTPITNRPFAIQYDPLTAKYWIQAVV